MFHAGCCVLYQCLLSPNLAVIERERERERVISCVDDWTLRLVLPLCSEGNQYGQTAC